MKQNSPLEKVRVVAQRRILTCPSHFVRLTARSFEAIDRRLAALGLSRFYRALPPMPLAGPLPRRYNGVVMDKADDVTTGKPVLTPGRIEEALRGPLPGRPAQIRMAPVPRPLDPPTPEHQPRKAGVLLLLYPAQKGSELCLVLTRRTESVADHKGQISLPGGAVHPDDLSLAHTALREACEEIGICTDDARVLGMLTPVYIEPSDFCIQPYVAYLPHRPMFELQPDEVAEILEVPVSHFLDERNVAVEEWTAHGGSTRVPYFDVSGHKVWGATAMVLAEFTAILSGIADRSPI
jgi:8-oxo-dGTP pyrophosphatase MutT (NUDIX family)